MNDNSIHGAPKKVAGRTEWSTGYLFIYLFLPKKENMLFAKKNKSFARAPYLIETTYSCQG